VCRSLTGHLIAAWASGIFGHVNTPLALTHLFVGSSLVRKSPSSKPLRHCTYAHSPLLDTKFSGPRW